MHFAVVWPATTLDIHCLERHTAGFHARSRSFESVFAVLGRQAGVFIGSLAFHVPTRPASNCVCSWHGLASHAEQGRLS